MRASQRLKRTGKRRTALPPVRQILVEAKALRQIAPNDPGVVALCDAVEEMAAGFVRHGGGEATKPRPLHPLWKREPPEKL